MVAVAVQAALSFGDAVASRSRRVTEVITPRSTSTSTTIPTTRRTLVRLGFAPAGGYPSGGGGTDGGGERPGPAGSAAADQCGGSGIAPGGAESGGSGI